MDPHWFFTPTYFCILYFFYLLFSTLKSYLFVDILAFNILRYKPCAYGPVYDVRTRTHYVCVLLSQNY